MDKAMGGKVVDGWIAIIKDEDEAMGAEQIDAQAWVVKHDRKDKNALAKATIPAALRNNGRKANGRRNPVLPGVGTVVIVPNKINGTYTYLIGAEAPGKKSKARAFFGIRVPDLSTAREVVNYARDHGLKEYVYDTSSLGDVSLGALVQASHARFAAREDERKALQKEGGAAFTVDPDAVRDLVLYAQNDGRLYERLAQPLMLNLARKLAAGTFDRALAVKGMVPLADAAAKGYTKEFGAGSGFGIFSAATRRAAAADLLAGYMEEIEGKAAMFGGKRTGRRNPIVSFQTKNGPVSFTAKKKR
jgi:hypothetical protein